MHGKPLMRIQRSEILKLLFVCVCLPNAVCPAPIPTGCFLRLLVHALSPQRASNPVPTPFPVHNCTGVMMPFLYLWSEHRCFSFLFCFLLYWDSVLVLKPRLTLNLWSFCFYPSSVNIAGMYPHTWIRHSSWYHVAIIKSINLFQDGI